MRVKAKPNPSLPQTQKRIEAFVLAHPELFVEPDDWESAKAACDRVSKAFQQVDAASPRQQKGPASFDMMSTDLARELKIAVTTFFKWRAEYNLPYIKKNGAHYFTPETQAIFFQIQALMKECPGRSHQEVKALLAANPADRSA